MSCKKANHNISCRVVSCDYHCDNEDFCSLERIEVAPCSNCFNGKAGDESMCASYKCGK